MGYRALRDKIEDKKKLFKRVALCIFAVILAVGVVFSCIVPPEGWKYYVGKPKLSKRKTGELRIHYIDVGQGDCTLIELPDGKTVLIDGGEDSGKVKKQVLRYLNALKIGRIDHLVVTHTDGDHCGSLEEVFAYKKILNAYLPPSFEASNIEYAEMYEALVKEKCRQYTTSRSIDLSGKGEMPYTLRFLYPYAEETGAQTDGSSVLWLEYNGVSAIFCGDAAFSTEEALVREDKLGLLEPLGVSLDDTNILKVAHHGSASSTSKEWLEYLGAETAVISCGAENAYGHPSGEVLQRLNSVGTQIYRTDMQGNILITLRKEGTYTVKAEKNR